MDDDEDDEDDEDDDNLGEFAPPLEDEVSVEEHAPAGAGSPGVDNPDQSDARTDSSTD